MSQIKKLTAIGRKLEKLSAQYSRLEWYSTPPDTISAPRRPIRRWSRF